MEVQVESEDDDEVTLMEVGVPKESISDQLQFWCTAATKMEHSNVGTRDGLFEILKMIKILKTMQYNW